MLTSTLQLLFSVEPPVQMWGLVSDTCQLESQAAVGNPKVEPSEVAVLTPVPAPAAPTAFVDSRFSVCCTPESWESQGCLAAHPGFRALLWATTLPQGRVGLLRPLLQNHLHTLTGSGGVENSVGLGCAQDFPFFQTCWAQR